MKFNDTLKKAVKRNLDTGKVPMLIGEPGTGKSSWVDGLADDLGTRCFTVACNQLADKADLTGARLIPHMISVKDKDGNYHEEQNGYKQVFYPHAVIMEAISYAEANPRENPILFLDELNRTTPDVTSEALSIPTLRSIGSIKLPKNLKVIAAGNDKGNVTSLDTASISRFVLYRVTPDVATFMSVLGENLHPSIEKVLNEHPELIFCKPSDLGYAREEDDNDDEEFDMDLDLISSETMEQFTTPRTIEALSLFLLSLTSDEMEELIAETETVKGIEKNILEEIIEGHIGETPFKVHLMAKLYDFVNENRKAKNLPSNPKKTISKPSGFDDYRNMKTIDELNDFVENLTEREKSSYLAYALYEKEDNGILIIAIAGQLTHMDSENLQKLMLCVEDLDYENVNTLSSMAGTLKDQLNSIISVRMQG